MIRELGILDLGSVAKLHTEAFKNDRPLAKCLRYSYDDFYRLWKSIYGLFLSSKSFLVYGYFEGDLKGFAACSCRRFPNPGSVLKFLYRMVKNLGIAKTWRFIRFCFLYELGSMGNISCLRLLFIGVDERERCRGIATKLLRFLDKKYAELGYRGIQLEVEEINPSKELYLREGFVFRNDFRVDGERWLVMLKK